MQRYDAGVIIWDRQAGQEIYRNNLEGLEQGGPVTEEEVAVLAEKRTER